MSTNVKIDPNFTRLRKTLLLQGKADRVPLFDFNIHDSIKEKIIKRPLRTVEDELDFWIKAGYDYVQVRLVSKTCSGNYNKRKISHSISTSHGNLKSIAELNDREFEWTPVFKNTWEFEDYNYEFLKSLSYKLPQDMKFVVHAADIFTRSWMVMGFEDFCYALYDECDLIAELFKQNAIAEIRMLQVLLESFGSKIGAVFYSDDLAYTGGLMVPLSVYRTYLWPYLEEIIKIARQLDVPVIYHTDGRLWELFDDFAAMGINGIQPLEPKSMDLVELKHKRGHQFCLMGSIDIDSICRGTSDEIREMVRERIELLGYNGGYTVGTSNTVPDYVNVDNYIAMIEATYEYGRY